MTIPVDDSYDAFADWVSTKPQAIQEDLLMIYSKPSSRQQFLQIYRRTSERIKKDDARERWKKVCWAVNVRTYALHWLEDYAKTKELQRIQQVASDPMYDPLITV